MNREEFKASLAHEEPPDGLSAPLTALWWDAKQDWTRAHALVDGTNVPGADFAARHWMKSGKRWWTVCFPALTKDKCPS